MKNKDRKPGGGVPFATIKDRFVSRLENLAVAGNVNPKQYAEIARTCELIFASQTEVAKNPATHSSGRFRNER